MAILNILHFPDPRLRKVAQPIAKVTDDIRQLADNMLETMYEAPGIGLAATQVNVQKRILVIDISEDKSDPLVLINPEILDAEGEREYEEGCLSVPEAYEAVTRADKVKIKAVNLQGEDFEFNADGLLATCVQHNLVSPCRLLTVDNAVNIGLYNSYSHF